MAGLTATEDGIKQINRVLTDKEWTREDLAEQCGCSRQPAISFGSGSKPISRKLFVSFCKKLGLDWEVVAGLKLAEAVTESKQSELIDLLQNYEGISIVKQIAVNLKVQIDNLYELSRYFSASNESTLYHTNRLHEFFEITSAYIFRIRHNSIDEFALRKLSIFSLEELEFVADHSGQLASLLLEIELYVSKYKKLDHKSSYFELGLSPHMTHVAYLSKQIRELELYSKLQMIILCRKLRDDDEFLDRYNKYKNELIDDYGLIGNRIEIYEIDFRLSDCLQNIEEWFKKFELSNELESSYKRQKLEFERVKELEILRLKSIQN